MQLNLSGKKVAIIIAMLAAFGMASSTSAAYNFFYVLGESIAISLFFYLFLELFLLKKIVVGVKARLFAFGLLIAIGVLGGYAKAAYEDYQGERMNAGIAAAMEDYLSGKQVSSEPFAAGDFGKLEKSLRLFLKKQSESLSRYQAEIQKTGILNILAPEQLNSDLDLRKAKLAIALSMPIVKKFSTDASRQDDLFREEIGSLQMNDQKKDEFLAGFDSGRQSQRSQSGHTSRERWWYLERASIGKIDKIISFLERTKGGWSVRDDSIYFTEARASREYDEMLVDLQRLVDEQDQITKTKTTDFNKLKK
jgi:hypothetical protein